MAETSAKHVVGRLKNRADTPQLSLVKDFASTMYLRIDLPLPLKKVRAARKGFFKTFADDENADFSDITTGKKLSPLSNQLAYMFCFTAYFMLQFLVFNWRSDVAVKFYTMLFVPLFLIRVHSFNSLGMHYLLLDYCYFTAFLAIFTLNFGMTNPALFYLSFMLSTGLPLTTPFLFPVYNALNLTHVSKLTSNLLHFVPALLFFFTKRRMVWRYDEYFENLTFQTKFVYPMVFYASWQVFYLFITEVLDYNKIYNNQVESYETTLKLAVANKGIRTFMSNLLKDLRILKRATIFKPEKKRLHHSLAAGIFSLGNLLLMACLLPISNLMFKNDVIFSMVLLLAFGRILYNGAMLTFPSDGEANEADVASIRMQKLESLGLEDEESLSEGGDEPNEKPTNKKTVSFDEKIENKEKAEEEVTSALVKGEVVLSKSALDKEL